MARCRGKKADGSPCGCPEGMVNPETGYCPAHGPDAAERMRERARKGGQATARRFHSPGVETETWKLNTHEDAKAWLHRVAMLVLAKKITHHQATAAVRAVEAWLRAEGERLTVQVVEELRGEVDRLKAELGGRPKLRVR